MGMLLSSWVAVCILLEDIIIIVNLFPYTELPHCVESMPSVDHVMMQDNALSMGLVKAMEHVLGLQYRVLQINVKVLFVILLSDALISISAIAVVTIATSVLRMIPVGMVHAPVRKLLALPKINVKAQSVFQALAVYW